MSTPKLVMFDVPLDDAEALRWGTRTPDDFMCDRADDTMGSTSIEDGLRIFQVARCRDVEEPARVQLAACAYDFLKVPSLKQKLTGSVHVHVRPRKRQHWFLWEAKSRLTKVRQEDVHRLGDEIATHCRIGSGLYGETFPKTLVAITAAEDALVNVDKLIARLIRRVELVTAPPRMGQGQGFAPTLVIGTTPDPSDTAEALSFRESLLALGWPDSKTVGRQLGSTGTGVEARVSRERAEGTLFGVWAGRARGGYQHPSFQFLPSGSPHPRLPELLDALARRPDLAPVADRSGWERAFWLYQPRGRLSEQALALRAAAPAQFRAAPERFAALPDTARTPADVFQHDPQAVIDLARDDAAAQVPPEASDTREAPRHG